jgi:hypothetical protein
VPDSSSASFPDAGTFYWAAFYSGDGNNAAAVSDCGSEVLTVVGITAQIAPTGTTCQQFLGGTASTLTQVVYQTRGTSVIKNAQPGVFFYYAKVTAPAATFTVDIPQAIQAGQTGPLFGIQSTSAYNGSCSSYKSVSISGGPADDVIHFTRATSGATYVVAVKYNVKSIVGRPKPNPANIVYTFSTKVNSAAVAGTAQSVNLVKTG